MLRKSRRWDLLEVEAVAIDLRKELRKAPLESKGRGQGVMHSISSTKFHVAIRSCCTAAKYSILHLVDTLPRYNKTIQFAGYLFLLSRTPENAKHLDLSMHEKLKAVATASARLTAPTGPFQALQAEPSRRILMLHRRTFGKVSTHEPLCLLLALAVPLRLLGLVTLGPLCLMHLRLLDLALVTRVF